MDFINDTNTGTIARVAEVMGGVPEYVASAQVKTAEDLNGMDSGLFADGVQREFPISDKAMTWLSAAYFYGRERNRMTPGNSRIVDDGIKFAAQTHGITEDVLDILKKVGFAMEAKVASDNDDNYALVVEWQGKKLRRYPVKSAEDVREGFEYFIRNEDKYPLEWKRQICNNLIKKGNEFKVDSCPTRVACWAHDNKFPDLEFFCEEVERRKLLLDDNYKEAADAILCVAKTGLEMRPEEFTPDTIDQLLFLLSDLDKMASLEVHYGKRLLNPVASLYNLDIAKVAEIVDVIPMLNLHVPVADFMNLSVEKYAEILGQDFADSLMHEKKLSEDKVRAIIPTLPDPDKRALLQVM